MAAGGASSIFGDLDVEARADAPVGAETWYGVGGRADALVRPNTIEALGTLLRRCHRSGTPVRVLGAGANLLVADEGVDGVVVRLDTASFMDVRYNKSGPATIVRAGAGADLPKTLMENTRRGLDGLTQMAGIPASVGGAVHMNAGGKYGCISDTLLEVTCMTSRGEVVTYPAEEITFGYRTTNIPDPIILNATFQLEPTDPIELRERVKEIFAWKKSTQPLAEHSAGCAFRNPIDPVSEERVSAGLLIDRAGLKGYAVGGASVSRRHGNFIVTKGGAKANDVIAVMEQCEKVVYDTFGIELQREVVVWRRPVAAADATGAISL